MNMAHNAILKHQLDPSGNCKCTITFYLSSPSLFTDSSYTNESLIVTYIMPLYPHKANLTIDVTNLLAGILYPFAASFLFPVSTNIILAPPLYLS